MQAWNHGPKPKCCNKFDKKDLSTRSKAFSWSRDKRIPVSFLRSMKASVSRRNARLEKIVLPGIEQVWSGSTIEPKTFASRIETALEQIL